MVLPVRIIAKPKRPINICGIEIGGVGFRSEISWQWDSTKTENPKNLGALPNLKLEIENKSVLSFDSLKPLDSSLEFKANLGFNLGIFRIARANRSNPSQAKEILLDVLSRRDPTYRFAITQLAARYGKCEVVIYERECVSLVRRFLEKIDSFEKDPAANIDSLRRDAHEIWTVASFPLKDLLGENNSQMIAQHIKHYMQALEFLHDLKPLLAYIYPHENFSLPILQRINMNAELLADSQQRQEMTAKLLRGAALAVVGLLMDFTLRNKYLILKA